MKDLPFEDFSNDFEHEYYLYQLTGYRYEYAVSSFRQWNDDEVEEGVFYQIMDNEEDEGFFDWYCSKRPNNQFFLFKETCLLHFVYYWNMWKSEGKPRAF